MMNILIIGKGGREHALAWKIKQSPKAGKLWVMPGNGGTNSLGENVSIDPGDHEKVGRFCVQNKINMVVIGPDEYLANGLTDFLLTKGVRVFGPTKNAARIEWSKSYAKEFMMEYNIPTASYKVFNDPKEAIDHLRVGSFPVVIKANGLAAGKGVVVAHDLPTAEAAVISMLSERVFGEAGSSIVIEEFLEGREISVHAFCDGNSAVLFPAAQDHKRRFEGDLGPNTGGMGVVAPLSWVTDDLMKRIAREIVDPAVAALKKRGAPFVGVLYPGIMVTASGPKVIEWNVRFGDPETQAYMPLLKTDLVDILLACTEGKIQSANIEWENFSTCCVSLVSAGYPGP